jgi:hypothetical protein
VDVLHDLKQFVPQLSQILESMVDCDPPRYAPVAGALGVRHEGHDVIVGWWQGAGCTLSDIRESPGSL